METIKKLLKWLEPMPTWLRALVLVLLAAIALIATTTLQSCGTPKTMATVTNVNPNSTVTVTLSVHNSNSTTNNVDPTVTVDPLID